MSSGPTLVAGAPAAERTVAPHVPTDWRTAAMGRRLRRRYAAERRFRLAGLLAVTGSAAFLLFLLATMLANGLGGFTRSYVRLSIDFPALALPVTPAGLRGPGAERALAGAGLRDAVARAADSAFGDGGAVIADSAWLTVRGALLRDPGLLGERTVIAVPASSRLHAALRGRGTPEDTVTADRLAGLRLVSTRFDPGFLARGDATDPAAAGIWGALKGSLLTLAVTLALAFPVGTLAAVYLEEYAPRNRWTDLIEVSINNLAAVPSIIFGLLGLAVFLGTLGLPRSAPIVGGLTLALMIMPVIVIAARNAIKAVPPSIRDAALGIGASRIQVVFHHVLPLALPGILTGTIIGMARALGETAPLLLIGMRAFIATPPGGLADPATVLPVQIFLWSDEVSAGFVERTSAAILVLLAVLMSMNALAIYLRNRLETRW